MKYLAILGRIPELSRAELRALFQEVLPKGSGMATFSAEREPNIDRLGGTMKLGRKLERPLVDFLMDLPEGKITIGVSDYSPRGTRRSANAEAVKLKRILKRHGRSVRTLPNTEATLSTAAVLHNGLGRKERCVEIMIVGKEKYVGIGVQNIEAYARRDQARPARDARVGMLPPKLAQILVNLAGDLAEGSRILDPFCGTGVVLQEAFLMGYTPYGTDASERMVKYTEQNLRWIAERSGSSAEDFSFEVGDAREFKWEGPIDAVVCETYLGPPLSQPPGEMKLKEVKQECGGIIRGFLKNLAGQIETGTPVVLATPAWRRGDGSYEGIFGDVWGVSGDPSGDLRGGLDKFEKVRYNGSEDSGFVGLYYREGQVVAREIIVLRKR